MLTSVPVSTLAAPCDFASHSVPVGRAPAVKQGRCSLLVQQLRYILLKQHFPLKKNIALYQNQCVWGKCQFWPNFTWGRWGGVNHVHIFHLGISTIKNHIYVFSSKPSNKCNGFHLHFANILQTGKTSTKYCLNKISCLVGGVQSVLALIRFWNVVKQFKVPWNPMKQQPPKK